MDLALKAEHKAFADEVREFARKNLSPATKAKTFSGKHYDRADHMIWQQALGKQGWLAYTWPKKYGGPGGDGYPRFPFEDRVLQEGAPPGLPSGVKNTRPRALICVPPRATERLLPRITPPAAPHA